MNQNLGLDVYFQQSIFGEIKNRLNTIQNNASIMNYFILQKRVFFNYFLFIYFRIFSCNR